MFLSTLFTSVSSEQNRRRRKLPCDFVWWVREYRIKKTSSGEERPSSMLQMVTGDLSEKFLFVVRVQARFPLASLDRKSLLFSLVRFVMKERGACLPRGLHVSSQMLLVEKKWLRGWKMPLGTYERNDWIIRFLVCGVSIYRLILAWLIGSVI